MMFYLFVGILLGTLPAITGTTCVESMTPEVIDKIVSCLSNIAACQAKNQLNQETTGTNYSTKIQQQSTATNAKIQWTTAQTRDVTTLATTDITTKRIAEAKATTVGVAETSTNAATIVMSLSTSADLQRDNNSMTTSNRTKPAASTNESDALFVSAETQETIFSTEFQQQSTSIDAVIQTTNDEIAGRLTALVSTGFKEIERALSTTDKDATISTDIVFPTTSLSASADTIPTAKSDRTESPSTYKSNTSLVSAETMKKMFSTGSQQQFTVTGAKIQWTTAQARDVSTSATTDITTIKVVEAKATTDRETTLLNDAASIVMSKFTNTMIPMTKSDRTESLSSHKINISFVSEKITKAVFSTEYQQQSTVTLANIQSTNGKAGDVKTSPITDITIKEIVDAKTPMVGVTTNSTDKSTVVMSSSTSAVCKAGWKFFQNRCYYFESNKKVNWSLAEVDCVKHGGHLASIHSTDENNFIENLIKNETWIGANDIDQENNFTWTDGSNFSSSDWHNNRPNDKNNTKNCVVFRPNASWNDAECYKNRNYICKIIPL